MLFRIAVCHNNAIIRKCIKIAIDHPTTRVSLCNFKALKANITKLFFSDLVFIVIRDKYNTTFIKNK